MVRNLLTAAIAAMIAAGCLPAATNEPRGADEFAVHPSDKVNSDAMARMRWAEADGLAGQLMQGQGDAGEDEGEPIWDGALAEYDYEPVYASGGYSGGSEATTLDDLLNGQGRAWDDGTSYTWYPHDIGYGALDIPGEWFDEDGVSHDADGYIVVAADGYGMGEVIDTPYGAARNYDSGSGYGNVDVYTNR